MVYQLIDLLGIIYLVEKCQNVGHSKAGKAITLIVGQNVQVLIVGFSNKAILLVVALPFTIYCIAKGYVS